MLSFWSVSKSTFTIRSLAGAPREQSAEAEILKSKGLTPSVEGAPRTAAQRHASLPARDGFDINQMAAEYRALRASVLRLWLAESPPAPEDVQDVIRFNEAIDQALAESEKGLQPGRRERAQPADGHARPRHAQPARRHRHDGQLPHQTQRG
jgi:hypothetical protein